jgi:hypothetical protein
MTEPKNGNSAASAILYLSSPRVTHQLAELVAVNEVDGGCRDRCCFASGGREPGEGHKDGPFRTGVALEASGHGCGRSSLA